MHNEQWRRLDAKTIVVDVGLSDFARMMAKKGSGGRRLGKKERELGFSFKGKP